MTDVYPFPEYLLAEWRERQATIDRSRLCECIDPKNFRADAECEPCGGTGLSPTPDDELSPDELRRKGFEPLPPDHPANFEESYTVGLGGSGPRR